MPGARIFITGIAGFLGSHLADAMLAAGHAVSGIDNLIGGAIENVPRSCRFTQGDCNDLPLLLDAMRGAEVVYHCAATAHEGLSVFSPHLITRNTVTASTGVFSAAAACGVRRVVFCSSMARYGANAVPFTEDQTPRPQDPYGIGKHAAEQILRSLAEVHGFEWVIAVPHNIIGPRQKYDDPFRNVAAIFINLMLQGRQPYIYGDGGQMRCFSVVDDAVAPLAQMACDPAVVGEIVNIGPDDEFVSINALAATIADLIGFDLRPHRIPARPQEVRLANCSADKARRLLGYRPGLTLRDGLAAMIAHIRDSGPKPFHYHLDLEIRNRHMPATWRERLF